MAREANKALRVEGGEALLKALKEFEPKFAKKILRQAIRKGLRPMLAEAQANATVKTGQTRKAIKIRAKKRSRNRIGLVISLNAENFSGKQFPGAFEELGWKTGNRKSDPANRREIPGKHFLGKAFKDKGHSTIEATRQELVAGVERIANELGPRTK